jgi:hypothetical protein
MNFIGIGTIILLCYYGELVLAVMLISVLLAFVLAPLWICCSSSACREVWRLSLPF